MPCKRIASMVLGLTLILPVGAWAWDGITSGTVGRIQQYSDGSFVFQLTSLAALCPGPAPGSWSAVNGFVSAGPSGYPGMTADGVKAMLANLLAAKLSGRAVVVYANNNPTNPTGNSCVVGAIDF